MPSLLIRVLFIGLVSGFFSCKGDHAGDSSPAQSATASNTLVVQSLVASPQALSADIEIPGVILANETTDIHPEIAGRIVQLHLREGTSVSKGALLAKLYDGDLQAQLRKLEVQQSIAEQTEQRQASLLKIQGISQQDYDLSLLSVLNLKADIDIIREAIRKTEIRAPFSGKLGLKNVSPGAYVTPANILSTISQINSLKLQFNVPERYGSMMNKGMTVHFAVDGSSRTFSAVVIASEISIDESTRSLAIRASIKQLDPVLIPGVFAKVKIVLGKNSEALMVPNSAIIPVGRKKQLYIYQSGKAMVREVTTGVRDSSNIQILTGLDIGDTVITSAILYLRPGIEVELGGEL